MIGLFILLAYLCLCYLLFGLTPSISDTFYKWKQLLEKSKYESLTLFSWPLFLIFAWAVPISIFYEFPSEYLNGWLSFACFGLMCVGVVPFFKQDKMSSLLHFVSAIICGGLAFVWCCVMGTWLVGLISILAGLLIGLMNKKNLTYWVEIGLFAQVFVSYLFLIS